MKNDYLKLYKNYEKKSNMLTVEPKAIRYEAEVKFYGVISWNTYL